ncbi:ABC transporter ATP-binding protein [Pseudomonas sp. NCCP-436]|uniref:ABC transporter ATP-binding protein n=1 Tax=Pseudomonas sp. NCCP-436 TaxID=2842481 RepID=UPI001C8232F3|nr:ABC transporter ATP-binding protein [Pseudomonas sp. NCCP-436]GIZ12517.1 ABC transporter ATP-binding protein [Pseudomonas sp. NCCP-436]
MTAAEDTEHPGKAIARLLRPVHGQLLLATLLAALGGMLMLLPLAAIARLAETPQETTTLLAIGLGGLFAGLLLWALGETVAHQADNRITGQLRLAIVQRLAQVPLGWFTKRSSGEVKQAIQDDIGALHGLVAHFFTTLGRAAGTVLLALIYLTLTDWRMTLVALLPFLLFFLFFRRALRASAANLDTFGQGMLRINTALGEYVRGLPVVKAFAAEQRSAISYHRAVDDFACAFDDFTRPLAGSMANANALLAPATVLGVVLAGGALLVSLGWVEPLQVLPFALVAPGLCAPLLLLKYISHDLNHAGAAAQRVEALLHTPRLESGSAVPADCCVRFEQVGYAYQPGAPVLEDISLELQPGTITAVVGSSGSGKSTLARLLLRFFDPDAGRITLGAVDLRDMPTSQLYRMVGFVLQEVQLIHASVRDNIALGRPQASQEEIEAAARLAGLHERILALPNGYATLLGEQAELSGGERQRLSIARALLSNPPVLVLDEPTAAADADSEAQLQQALSDFSRGRTLLVIAHRLDTIQHADQIIVLDRGRILEQGRHDQLLALGGHYARLWARGGYQQDGGLPAC